MCYASRQRWYRSIRQTTERCNILTCLKLTEAGLSPGWHQAIIWTNGGILLTHWGRDNMADISQTIFSNAFSWMKIYEFRLIFHWSLFLWFWLTISQHWFRQWLGADQATSHFLNQWSLAYWHIYASLGLDELIGPLGTKFKETLIEINIFSFKKMRLNMSSAKCRLPSCLGLNVLTPDHRRSENGLSPFLRQATIWTNAGLLSIWPQGINFNEIIIKIQQFRSGKMHFKMSVNNDHIGSAWMCSDRGLGLLLIWISFYPLMDK